MGRTLRSFVVHVKRDRDARVALKHAVPKEANPDANVGNLDTLLTIQYSVNYIV